MPLFVCHKKMLNKLTGRVALVTGCSSAIGRRISERLESDAGMKVVGVSRRAPVFPLPHIAADITTEADCVRVSKTVKEEFGTPALVVHCAGAGYSGLLLKTSEEHMNLVVRTNVVGPLSLTKHLLRSGGMLSAKAGAFVFMGSVVGSYGNAGQVAYASSKAALSGAVMSLAKEYGSSSLRFNVLAPGLVEGPGMGESVTPEVREKWKSQCCLHRLLTPDDIADTVFLLAVCEMMNGQTINLDGGRL